MSARRLYDRVTACRVCGGEHLLTVIDLGSQYLASNLVESNEGLPLDDLKAPLSCVLCRDCGLLQLHETVDRDELFRAYFYRSATNPMMLAALRDVMSEALTRVDLSPGDVVVDIGANDGTLLGLFPPEYRRVGVEPARNISRPDLDGSIRIVNAFFTREVVEEALGGVSAKLVTSIAMMYSVPDLNRFTRGVKSILAEDGVWITQLSYLPSIIDNLSFFDICHEHIYYFTLGTLMHLLELNGFSVIDVSTNKVNGGSIRAYVTHAERGCEPAQTVRDMLAKEAGEGWSRPATYTGFMEHVDSMRSAVVGYLEEEQGVALGRGRIEDELELVLIA